jgi:sporulation protein YlmC with PRC-barrel domain
MRNSEQAGAPRASGIEGWSSDALCGMNVADASGGRVGTVTALVVDGPSGPVRFLLVARGISGTQGAEGTDRLVPAEAVDRVQGGVLQLRYPRERVTFGPQYNPKLVGGRAYWEAIYRWYGHAPYLGKLPSSAATLRINPCAAE